MLPGCRNSSDKAELAPHGAPTVEMVLLYVRKQCFQLQGILPIGCTISQKLQQLPLDVRLGFASGGWNFGAKIQRTVYPAQSRLLGSLLSLGEQSSHVPAQIYLDSDCCGHSQPKAYYLVFI